MRDTHRYVTRSAPLLCAAVGLSGLLSAQSGCASASERRYGVYVLAPRGNAAAAALPAPGIYRDGPIRGAGVLGSNVGAEAYRLNDDLTAREALPLSALGQWPEPIPPREDPINFDRWEQD